MAWGGVEEPSQRRAAAGGGERGPLCADPWEGWLWRWRAAPLCSRPLKQQGTVRRKFYYMFTLNL